MLEKGASLMIAAIMSMCFIPVAGSDYMHPGLTMETENDFAGPQWPMFRYNANHTGLSPYDTSGNAGKLKWSFGTEGKVSSSPAVGSDGTIYVGSADDRLYAINPDGTEKWNFTTGDWVRSSPAIGTDGTIYVGSFDCRLYAINPDGTEKWSFPTGDYVESSPTIGTDGAIYVGSRSGRLYAINPDGSQRWVFSTHSSLYSSPAIGTDGTVYVGYYNGGLYAINPDGTEKWNYLTPYWIDSSPAIGSDGTIYIGSYYKAIFAIRPDGTLKWFFPTGDIVSSSAAIGHDGSIYVGSNDGRLYSLNPDGTQKWNFTIGGPVSSSPAIGSDGTVYLGPDGGAMVNFFAVNPDGTQKWSITVNSIESSPAISSDGTVYVGSRQGLLAIGNPMSQPPVADAGPDQTVYEGDVLIFNGTGSFNPDGGEGKWIRKKDIPIWQLGGASAVLDDEIYYVAGEPFPISPPEVSLFQKYNPATDTWSGLPGLPAVRIHLGAAVAIGKFYAFGGSDVSNSTDTTFEFDPITNVWTTKAPMPMPLERFGTASVGGRIYIIGGSSTLIDCYPCGSVFEYDPISDSWNSKPDMLTGRANLAVAVLDSKIYAIGGDAYSALDVVEVYDPIAENWTAVTNMTFPLLGLSAEAMGGRIYAYGGMSTWGAPSNMTLMYDPSGQDWTIVSSMNEARLHFGSGAVGNCVYAISGYGAAVYWDNTTEEYCLRGELAFSWDFDSSVDLDGDGNYTNDNEATDPSPTHVYFDDGIYTATLTVTDPQGLQDIDQCDITVLNVPPIPEWTSRSLDGTILNPPYPEGIEILFEATVYDPGIHDTFTYDWDFGDGRVLLDAGPTVTHAYGDNDTYVVLLKVTDDDGGVGTDDTPPLLTENEDPVAWISLPRCPFFEGGPGCPMDGYFTDPGWLDTHSAVWDFGDGEQETAVLTEENEQPDSTGNNMTSHVYGDDGVYNVTFTVVDDDGGTDVALAWPSPYNLPPSIDFDVPSSVNEGEHFVLGVVVTDPGSDDLIISIEWGDGISESEIYYNNGIGPDPPNSSPGVFPFTAQSNFSHVYGDDGCFTITVKAEDDDGGMASDETIIVVENVAPTIEYLDILLNVSLAFRIAGEKWHDVEVSLFEDGAEVGRVNLTRYPGSPDDQMAHLADISMNPLSQYSAVAYYTPEDDPVNGQVLGATPAWLIVSYEDGTERRLHHTFVVRHPDTWIWTVDDFSTFFIGHNMTFVARGSDPGSDDLAFKWNWGDNTTNEHIYYNNGMSPDPYPSPDVNPIVVMEFATHRYDSPGTYTIVLALVDDDGGEFTIELIIVLG